MSPSFGLLPNATEPYTSTHNTKHTSETDLSIYEEYLSAIIPWLICVHNLFWCIYFFHKFGCCRNRFPAVSIGMQRSASLVFITHVIAPFFMGFSNFYLIIPLFDSSYPCTVDFIIQTLLYAFCKFALFLFFTFRVDVILRDSFFEYKRLQSWMVRLFGFLGFIAISIYLPMKIHGSLDSDADFCVLHPNSYLSLYIGVAINASFFLIVTVIFARKICQVTSSSTAVRLSSTDRDESGYAGFAELSYSASVNNESFKLIETLQYHTLLIALNVLIELILLFISRFFDKIIAISLAMSVFVDIWCLLLMFRKMWFKKYCNFCLVCSKPLWKCCGVSLPQLYNGYDRNDMSANYSAAEYNTNDSQHYLYGPTDTELTNTKASGNKSIWDKFKRNKSNPKKMKYKTSERELYQPLTQEYM